MWTAVAPEFVRKTILSAFMAQRCCDYAIDNNGVMALFKNNRIYPLDSAHSRLYAVNLYRRCPEET